MRDTLWLQWKWVNGNQSWHTVTTVRTQPAKSAAKPHILGKENALNWQLQALSRLPRTKTGRKKHYSAQFGYNGPTQQWLPIFALSHVLDCVCHRSTFLVLMCNHNNKQEDEWIPRYKAEMITWTSAKKMDSDRPNICSSHLREEKAWSKSS